MKKVSKKEEEQNEKEKKERKNKIKKKRKMTTVYRRDCFRPITESKFRKGSMHKLHGRASRKAQRVGR